MIRSIRWTFLLVLLPALVHAQSNTISLDEAVTLFEQNSLQQELARYDQLRKKGEAIQYKAYPNPEISINREQLNAGTIDYGETTFMISQPLELLGQPFLRNQSSAKIKEAADLQYEYDRLQLVRQVKSLYAEYWYLGQKLETYNRALEIVRQARTSARERKEEGVFSGLQVQRFNVELNRYRKARDQVQLSLQETGNRLATLIFSGDDSTRSIKVDDTLSVDPPGIKQDLLVQFSLANRPDLKALENRSDASALQFKVEKRERLPDLNVDFGYKNQSDGAEGFVIGGSIQLPVFNQNRGNVRKAEAHSRSQKTKLALKKQAVRHEVETAYLRVEQIWSQWRTMQEESMKLSMLEAAQTAYREGRYSLVELLDATEAYVDSQTMTYETIAEYNQALFELDLKSAGRISKTQNTE